MVSGINRLKILFVPTVGGGDDLLWGLIEKGIETESFSVVCPIAEYEESLLFDLMKYVERVDVIITQKFSTIVAEACHRKRKKYISWTDDSPQKELYLEEAKYDTNYIFAFDRRQMQRMRDYGLKRVFHEPLATNLSRVSGLIISDDDILKYGYSVSFVGNLRKNEQRRRFINSLPEDIRIYIQQNMLKVTGNWSKSDTAYLQYPQHVINLIDSLISRSLKSDVSIPAEYMVQTLIADEISYQERILVLNTLAKEYNVALFTQDGVDNTDVESKCMVFPPVSYDEEMPKVFYASKINLNITKRSIETGIPLRVFDIIGAGGFVLTDEREELYELFEVGREVETYSCLEELSDKIDFFMRNDNLRNRVICNGYNRVKECYTYPKAIERILKKALM